MTEQWLPNENDGAIVVPANPGEIGGATIEVAGPRGDCMAHIEWRSAEDYAVACAAPVAYAILVDIEQEIYAGRDPIDAEMIQRISQYLELTHDTKGCTP